MSEEEIDKCEDLLEVWKKEISQTKEKNILKVLQYQTMVQAENTQEFRLNIKN